MLLRVPDYYKEFHCIAKACKHNCCIGWEIDIDEDTYEYYQSVSGEFGSRLQQHMTQQEQEDRSFILQKNRCPFLNDENLCDICLHLGEESLCEICTEYPRFTTKYANVTEKCLGLSCEEACRIILSKKDKVYMTDLTFGDFKKDPQEETAALFLEIRTYAIKLLQNRAYEMNTRLIQYLEFCYFMQEKLNDVTRNCSLKDVKDLYDSICKKPLDSYTNPADAKKGLQSFEERFMLYQSLEVLNEEWSNYLIEMQQYMKNQTNSKLQDLWIQTLSTKEMQLELEQLAVYFTIRYFMRCIYTSDLLSQACFTIENLFFLKDMFQTNFLKKNGAHEKEDRYDLVRMYSSEIEHSQENIEQILETFIYEDKFKKQVLLYTLEVEK